MKREYSMIGSRDKKLHETLVIQINEIVREYEKNSPIIFFPYTPEYWTFL